ncbi:Dynamin central region-domain-containing protein [Suillus subalutaceus]|uniref:Dynamin central region-domain-containing protein n=1 Tax=Suillus subalutaceus TaxID=48586 RepID=UPI001B86F617|nr:Dynamin central region-domain-containing protein [Suillus subalutaceus]KAG1844351.1 Dynamin central region-domain-containing protein [Suillus subalutaceus]
MSLEKFITEFTNEFWTVIDGNTNDLLLNELSGGARISFIFHELFNNGMKGIDPFDQVKDGDIQTILYNSSGQTPSLFVGSQAFEIIVKQQIKQLEEPSVKCCQLIYDKLIRILGQLLQKIVHIHATQDCNDVLMGPYSKPSDVSLHSHYTLIMPLLLNVSP